MNTNQGNYKPLKPLGQRGLLPQSENMELKNALNISWWLNFGMWIIEVVAWVISNSSSLIMDWTDFLFDGTNYFSSKILIDKSDSIKTLVWKIKWFSLFLTGIWVGAWTGYKYYEWMQPEWWTMTLLAVWGFVVNAISIILVRKYKDSSLDLKAVWECTKNDMINNGVVMISWIGTSLLHSNIPDTIAWWIMSILAINSGYKIMQWKDSHEWHGHSCHSH